MRCYRAHWYLERLEDLHHRSLSVAPRPTDSRRGPHFSMEAPTRMYFLEREAHDDVDPDLNARNERLIKLNAKVKQQNKKKDSLLRLIEAMAPKDASEQNNKLREVQKELKTMKEHIFHQTNKNAY